jgi:hypothetical protein
MAASRERESTFADFLAAATKSHEDITKSKNLLIHFSSLSLLDFPPPIRCLSMIYLQNISARNFATFNGQHVFVLVSERKENNIWR